MTTQPKALRLADELEDDLADYGGQSLPRISQDIADNAAAELRRLHVQRDALLEALRRIAMASEATVCNQEWIAKTARAAIKAAEETK